MHAPCQAQVGNQESWRGPSHAQRLAHHDDTWSNAHAVIKGWVDRGMSLTELVRVWEFNVGRYDGFLPGSIANPLARVDLDKFSHEKEPHRLIVVDGHYKSSPTAANSDALIEVIARCIDPQVDCVVEFGSGIGINLARLRLRCPTLPVTYVACEPTAGGRAATRTLFSADPAARLLDNEFDYCRPNLDFLRGFRKIVAFTSHSIEQVPVLGEGFYRLLLDTNIAACVHIEPVGWQRFTNIAEVVQGWHRDPASWMHFFYTYEFVLDDARVVDNAAVWSAFCGYNTDLLRVIAGVATSGKISVTSLAYDVIGFNPFNPSTLIGWRANRAFA